MLLNPYTKLYATWPIRYLPVVAVVEVVVDVGIEVLEGEIVVGSAVHDKRNSKYIM